MLAWILGINRHNDSKWDARKYYFGPSKDAPPAAGLLEESRQRQVAGPVQSLCSQLPTEDVKRAMPLRHDTSGIECHDKTALHTTQAGNLAYAGYGSRITPTAVGPDVYDETRHDALPTERKVFNGKWEDPLSGIAYNMYEDAPPPPNGDFMTLGGARQMRRLQGYDLNLPPNDGVIKQEQNFKDAPAADTLADQLMSARRGEQMDYMYRDVSMNQNGNMACESQLTKDPVGMLGTKQVMLRFNPYVPPTAREDTCETERTGHAYAPRRHAKVPAQAPKNKRREVVAPPPGSASATDTVCMATPTALSTRASSIRDSVLGGRQTSGSVPVQKSALRDHVQDICLSEREMHYPEPMQTAAGRADCIRAAVHIPTATRHGKKQFDTNHLLQQKTTRIENTRPGPAAAVQIHTQRELSTSHHTAQTAPTKSGLRHKDIGRQYKGARAGQAGVVPPVQLHEHGESHRMPTQNRIRIPVAPQTLGKDAHTRSSASILRSGRRDAREAREMRNNNQPPPDPKRELGTSMEHMGARVDGATLRVQNKRERPVSKRLVSQAGGQVPQPPGV